MAKHIDRGFDIGRADRDALRRCAGEAQAEVAVLVGEDFRAAEIERLAVGSDHGFDLLVDEPDDVVEVGRSIEFREVDGERGRRRRRFRVGFSDRA
ncbi:hypothetical protein E6W36_07835 [Hankyongella ginsenosidimutans]|uniref:Uncharacterized protein n=1 Tax=Hankyongella ginsenosidimutans TaxID=1763828 RepID=A0A4D7C193_9SPHN|nr:hypothetical protein [Hankyongella ginsenosidimutans]QCI79484.1 hypothetical protein E6W36_07835 [Hankyongella ginsenosidimutans]